MPDSKKNYSGKNYQDHSKQLAHGANPTEWEQPHMNWSKNEFDKHRWVFCPWYRRCMNYAAGFHWKGWSCNWCKINPHRVRAKAQGDS